MLCGVQRDLTASEAVRGSLARIVAWEGGSAGAVGEKWGERTWHLFERHGESSRTAGIAVGWTEVLVEFFERCGEGVGFPRRWESDEDGAGEGRRGRGHDLL